jgi:hypothetical protein
MNNNLPSEVKNYLALFASEKWGLELNCNRLFDNIIIVPCLDEFDTLPKMLNSLEANNEFYLSKTLLIIVINNSVSADELIKINNVKTYEFLKQKYFCKKSQLNVGIVNAFEGIKAFDEKNAGVGLARKTGMDLALKYFDYKSHKKKTMICLDADCEVETNYLEAIINEFNNFETNAAYVNFEHSLNNSETINRAIIAYEIFLRYYVLGLTYSDSPFAFHSVGSTMICDYKAYIKIQGMNKRKAAEDFYFMEKLAKVYPIKKISETKIYPAARPSYRVPFGTGQRINRYLAGTHNEYELYSSEIFDVLKNWNNLFFLNNKLSSKEILVESEKIHPQLHVFLNNSKFSEQFEKIQDNSANANQLSIQKKLWFDGFKTLKLVHFLRDNAFPNVDMSFALDKMFERIKYPVNIKGNRHDFSDINLQKQYLDVLRRLA